MKTFYAGLEKELLVITETTQGYQVTRHFKGTNPTSIAIDPKDHNIVYCTTYGNGLWKSIDAGQHFEAIGQSNSYYTPNFGNGIASAYMTAVYIDDTTNILYVGTEQSALYYSHDEGQTFKEFEAIQSLPSKSRWQFPPRPETHHVQAIAGSYVNNQILNVAIEFGAVIRTIDGGHTWRDDEQPSPRDIHTLRNHPMVPGRLYAACGDGMLTAGHSYAESQDDGQTWTFKSDGIKHRYLYSLAVNAHNPEDIIVSAAHSAYEAHMPTNKKATVYRKLHNEAWQLWNEGLPFEESYIHKLIADPDKDGLFYALNNHGLYQRHSDNESWQQLELNWLDDYKDQHPSFLKVVTTKDE
ncbi:WD40/YVTN/BNR-like repeat-containing protein [Staphylococcus simiae]|uniref:BNR repeat domain protein n=1 Tax=Staphylococcus simiae CCM 7213 = CCUG 51256 TaxID=911238 RepID=G5JF39_9STAP|nr:sialidase family protein [Staphylococcus simiae]EHJ09203.1 BNR repeat domain protein [Staphylococcus simiae CCM 7213 = CCUG 51256]PNZ13893.1 exo-alpha-sialidase [Staphylococcus simiae]SNV59355.1 BNR repeat domain-containing protein [Staphylococcus simiae]